MARRSPQTERLVEIVEYLAAAPQDTHQLTDIARQLGIDKATCYPMLTELTRVGWLVKEQRTKAYRLGPRLVAVGEAAAVAQQLAEVAQPAIAALSADLGCMVCLVTPSSADLVIAHVERSPQDARPDLPVHPGDRLEFRPPLGAVLIAWAGPHAVDVWLRRDPVYAADPGQCHHTLGVVRGRGFAVEMLPVPITELRSMASDTIGEFYGSRRAQRMAGNQDHTLSSAQLLGDIDKGAVYEPLGISSACFDASGAAVAAVAVIEPPTPIAGAALMELGGRVRAAAAAVTARLGGHPPDA
ncbi:helix-turn-helix domain-containing protein [Mycolicibacterium sphagni]|nr:helix-turn-helix domain-containing protein [Mycolicibacterium sphagni]MCV7176134.1 helix-turn-helix domain-containing protein [Mycolicibacterium sphagni]